MNIKRFLNPYTLIEKKSFFLLGPRQTGKSWWIRNQLQHARIYNLLKSEDYTRLARYRQQNFIFLISEW
jgi:uncharacterized protein